METNQINTDKIAITGLAVYSPGWNGLDAFDREIYSGEPVTTEGLSPALEPQQALLNVISQVLGAGERERNSRVALLLITSNLLDEQQAARLAAQLHLTGPTLTVSGTGGVFRALELAQNLLESGEAGTVVLAAVGMALPAGAVNGHAPEVAAGAIRLESYRQAGQRVYARLEGLASGQFSGQLSAETVSKTCRQAFNVTGELEPAAVGYLEVSGNSETETEISALAQIYRGDAPGLTCAVSRLNRSFGEATGLFSLIKVALCLSRRYIPASTGRENPPDAPAWENSLFYLANKSRTWFLEKSQVRRVAALSHIGPDGSYAHLLLSEETGPQIRPAAHIEADPFYLFPLTASDQSGLLQRLELLQRDLSEEAALAGLARQYFQSFQLQTGLPYVLALVGHNRAELVQEIEKARAGLNNAFTKGREWHTPLGSYFTPRPLGVKGQVAFVYPGAFNSYVGLGQNLFRLFPGLYDHFAGQTADIGQWLAEKRLYPRSKRYLTPAQLDAFEERLAEDASGMILSGSAFAILFTRLMQNYFKIQPSAAFGYSLGESSMLWAMGVWDEFDRAIENFSRTPLFRTRLTGPKDTIRELWNLPPAQEDEEFWSTYFVLAQVERVKAALQDEPRVYLTHINTGEEVVICGDSAGCQRVIERLKCHYLRRPQSFVLHCPPVAAEFEELAKINLRPSKAIASVNFYSADGYTPLRLEPVELARRSAMMTCQQVDFPRLVNQVYEDGARIFIELGPGNTCTRWINKNLKNRDHLALPVNQKGVKEQVSIVRALAKLVSHRVPLDLSPLYPSAQAVNTNSISHPQLARLQENAARLAGLHAKFLTGRQQALGQMGELITLQMSLLKQATANPPVDTIGVSPFSPSPAEVIPPRREPMNRPAMFNQKQIEEFASGSVTKCFGPDFAACEGRRVPRIPNGDLMLMSRITALTGPRGDFEGVSTIEVEYDVPLTPWFCQQNSYPFIPYSIYMEMALQPCGFLSAYKGSFLLFPDKDLYFRNLDGEATLLHELDLRGKTVTTRARLLSTAVFEGTIIQRFEFECACNGVIFYRGSSAFGFFTLETMLKQIGLDGGKAVVPWIEQQSGEKLQLIRLDLTSPGVRADFYQAHSDRPYYHLAGGQLDLLDEVLLVPGGGRYGQGYIYASRKINPADWFYKCHFYQDAVMPGSLGVEAIQQAMQLYALQQNLGASLDSPRFGQRFDHTFNWKYRGQITPDNRKMSLEVHLHRPELSGGQISLTGEASLWKDALRIYEVKPVALSIYPTNCTNGKNEFDRETYLRKVQ